MLVRTGGIELSSALSLGNMLLDTACKLICNGTCNHDNWLIKNEKPYSQPKRALCLIEVLFVHNIRLSDKDNTAQIQSDVGENASELIKPEAIARTRCCGFN